MRGKRGIRMGWQPLISSSLLIPAALAVVTLTTRSVLAGSSLNRVAAQSQMELNKEACDAYKAADADMNKTYREIIQSYRGDRSFLAALKRTQLAWLKYRDAHVASVYPGNPSQYGSVNPMCRCLQLADITKERTKILNQWVNGVEEGDVCAGSVKTK